MDHLTLKQNILARAGVTKLVNVSMEVGGE